MDDVQQAEHIYNTVKEKLKGQEGKVIAIDAKSGEYFIGEDTFKAYEKGREKYPHREFFFKRIGAKTAFVIGAR